MDREEIKRRTKSVALRVIRLVQSLPHSPVADVIGRQLLRSGTSIGANYRAACRAKSKADHLNKLKIVEEEADESLYWLELLIEADIVTVSRLTGLTNEIDSILRIIVASIKAQRASNT